MNDSHIDECLNLLADRRRRRVIQQLRREADGRTTFDSLAERLRSNGFVSDSRPPDREQVAIQLEHSILPKLADHSVVEYDRQSGVIEYRPDERVEAVLDSLPASVACP